MIQCPVNPGFVNKHLRLIKAESTLIYSDIKINKRQNPMEVCID